MSCKVVRSDPATLRALKERLAAEQTNGHGDGADQ